MAKDINGGTVLIVQVFHFSLSQGMIIIIIIIIG